MGAGQYECREEGFDPPIKLSNITEKIDPHPACLNVDEMQVLIWVLLLRKLEKNKKTVA